MCIRDRAGMGGREVRVSESEGRRHVCLYEADGDRLPELLRHQRRSGESFVVNGGDQGGAAADGRESTTEGVRVDERCEADQLHQRQGRQAAGRALPPGELRAREEAVSYTHLTL